MRHALSAPPSFEADDPSVPARPSEDSKRSFLRMVSHELRTPLNSIIGFSEIIRQELFGPVGCPQYQEYAAFISSSGHRMLRLVNQIMEIVRLESRAEVLDLRAEDLRGAVEEAFEAFAEEARALGVTLAVEDAATLPTVLADYRALQTALSNLLQNALAYSPRGAPVRVRARADAGWVRIEIEDRGPGLDPADIPRLMRPFEQGQQPLTRRADGAGLGLPIVSLLCEAMGGAFTIESAEGAGLTAVITLPAA